MTDAHRHVPHTHPHPHHHEHHFSSSELIRDIVIGMADGLTVPFALAAGLTGAIAQTHLIVIAGGAEIAAGSIAMGLGGFLAARGDAEHYVSERAREQREVIEKTAAEEAEGYDVFQQNDVSEGERKPVHGLVKRIPKALGKVMMMLEVALP